MTSLSDIDRVALEGARLLLGVARLGDGDLRRWWHSAALDPDVGSYIVPSTFPRTGKVAAAQLLLLSAARRHQQILPRSNAVHLFSDRLPFNRWTWNWLAGQKTQTEVDPLIGELESWRDHVDAGKRLAEWTGPRGAGEFVAGTVELGTLGESELGPPGQSGDAPALLLRARELAAWYVGMTDLAPPLFNVRIP